MRRSRGPVPPTVTLAQKAAARQTGERSAAPADRMLFLQRTAGNRAVESVRHVVDSPGRPLDPATRGEMEDRFGRDLGDLRVHTDTRAAASASAIGAHAYAVGDEIAFGRGEYAPETTEGRRLLAHEIAHTLQQRDPAAPPPSNNPAGALETSARDAANSVAAGQPVAALPSAGVGLSMNAVSERDLAIKEAEEWVAESNRREKEEEEQEQEQRKAKPQRRIGEIPTTSSLIPVDPRWDVDRLMKQQPRNPDWDAYVAQRDAEERNRRIKQEVNDELRTDRFMALRKFLERKRHHRDQLAPFLSKNYSMRDLQILRHHGFKWGTRSAGSTKFQQTLMSAIEGYLAEQHNQQFGGADTMREWTQGDEDARVQKLQQEAHVKAWLEGLPHATGSVLGGASAWVASKFTDDPKKISAAAGFGTALSGVLGARARARAQQGSYVPEAEAPYSAPGAARYTGPAPTKPVDVVAKPTRSFPHVDLTGGKFFARPEQDWSKVQPTGPSFADVSMQLKFETPGTVRHRSSRAAARVARQSGLENAKRPGIHTHSVAGTIRKAFGLSGRRHESAHIVPQAVYRRLREMGIVTASGRPISEGRAFTTLLPKRAHKAFDGYWVARWNAAKEAGREITAGDLYKWVSEAVNRVDPRLMSNDLKGAINDRLRTELYSDLGMTASFVLVPAGTAVPQPNP